MKVLIVADLPSLYYATRKKFLRKIDYKSLLQKCLGTENTLFKAIAFGSRDAKESNAFYDYLKIIGFDCRFYYPFVIRLKKGTPEEKTIKRTNFAVPITVEVMKNLKNVDAIVVCSSNADLAPAISAIKESGLQAIIVSTKIPLALKKVATSWHEIDEDWLEVPKNVTPKTTEQL
jgi:uncharacterized LabA/DUF88 family protein